MYFIIESCSQKLRQLNLGLPSLQISVVSPSCIHGQSFYALWPSIFSLLGFTRMRYTNWELVMLMDSQEEDGWHRDSRSAEHTCSKSFGCRLRNSVISQKWSYTFLVQPLHEGTDQWTCSNGYVLCVDQPWKEINTPLSVLNICPESLKTAGMQSLCSAQSIMNHCQYLQAMRTRPGIKLQLRSWSKAF